MQDPKGHDKPTQETPHHEPRPKPEPTRGRQPGGSAPDAKGDRGGLQFDQQELNNVIALADRLAGDGHYDKAIARYNFVLKRDPKNRRALQGRARAIRNAGQK